MSELMTGELLSPVPQPWWPLLRQVGVRHVASTMRGAEQDRRLYSSVGGLHGNAADSAGVPPWSQAALTHDRDTLAEHGFTLSCIEDTPPLDLAREGRAGRDEQIDHVITQVEAMGRLGIPTLCYNWMTRSSWSRTRNDVPSRGGALVTEFRATDADELTPLSDPAELTPEQLWSALEYFLAAVLPVAEQSGVRLALHPDDPPLLRVRGVPRIMSSVEGFRRLLRMSTSPANAITFCQGNFALMCDDLPETIRELGGGNRIAYVHFRDVEGDAADFVETFHDDGPTDMAACLGAYHEVGFRGLLRPDHVPTLAGEPNDRPGYAVLGRLFAAGYIRGLLDGLGRS